MLVLGWFWPVLLFAQCLFQSHQISFPGTVQWVHFSPASWKDNASPLSHAIVELEDRLLFYDGSGQVSKEVSKGKGGIFTVSKQGRYLVVFERVKEATPAEPGLDRYLVYDHKGQLLWSKEEQKIHDLPEPVGFVYISDLDGTAIFVYDYRRTIEFYDRTGRLIRTVHAPIDPYFEGDVSRDGRYFGFVTGRRGKVWLALYSSHGDSLWQQPFPGEKIKGHLLLNPDASRIVVSAYHFKRVQGKRKHRLVGKTLVFNRSGGLLRSLPIYFSKAAFSGNNQYLILAHKESVHLVRLRDGQILFSKENFLRAHEPNRDCELRSVSAAPTGQFFLLGCSQANTQGPWSPKIFLLDRPGRVICSREFPKRFVSPTFPDFAQLSADGRMLAVVFKNSIEVYRINR
ncbi:MAG: hypothetical protein D6715_11235 [Calditrichaeota bacterium]|nr:MAG: hypothetical protein D6715_11235 [Calditrichota bacterium]